MLIGIIVGVVVGFVLGFMLGAGLSVVLLDDEYKPVPPVMYGYGGSDAGKNWRAPQPVDVLKTDENGDWIDDEQLRIWERRATK